MPSSPRRLLHTLAAVWLACLCTLAPLRAQAGIADAPGSTLQVDLYTYGPGTVYWERFGHDALILTDTRSGEAWAFNYGLFDFSQPGFYRNFARGNMIYLAAAWPVQDDVQLYAGEGRSITAQRLNLDPAQTAQLRDFLIWNVQPEHARYRYRYYRDNCTTRIRDALDAVMGGALRQQLAARSMPNETYRRETNRLMAGQPWLMLLMDLGLGPLADQPLNGWSGAFIPARLMHELRHAHTRDGSPLVVSATELSPQRLPAPPAGAPDLRWPLGGAGLVLGCAFLASAWLRERYAIDRWWFSIAGTLFVLLAGSIGVLLLVLWFATDHQAAWANENLLLFNPLAWLLVPGLLRLRKPAARTSHYTMVVTAVSALLAALALVAKLTPWLPQHNLPWILFALPAWLGLMLGLWCIRAAGPGSNRND